MKLNRSGAAQSTLVVIVSVATLLVLAGFIVFFVRYKINNREVGKRISQEIAEVGLTQALEKIKDDPTWTQGLQNVKCRDGFYSVSIEKVNDSIYKAVSTGSNAAGKTVILCTYKLEKADSVIKPKTLNWEYQ